MKKILTALALCSTLIFATGCGYNVVTPYYGVGVGSYGSGVSVGISSGYYPRYGHYPRYGVYPRYRVGVGYSARITRY